MDFIEINSVTLSWQKKKRMMDDICDLKKRAIEQLIKNFDNGDVNSIVKDFLFLLIIMNGQYKNDNPYDHELKKILFETNCIRNPLGAKYKEEDYNKTINVLKKIIHMANGINKNSVDTKGVLKEGYTFRDSLIDDCIEMLIYTECFYKMNLVNSRRMDENAISNLPFFEQLCSLLIFMQDQCRIVKENYNEFITKDGITGLELSIADRDVEFFEGKKSSIADNFESTFESANEIIRYLYYRYGRKLKQQIDLSQVDFSIIHPYENVDFQKYLYIAQQRHQLVRTEEDIRYSHKKIECIGKTEEGVLQYVAPVENDKKCEARMFGIFRREYLIRSNVLCDMRNEIDVAVAEKAISDLSNELINVQKEKFIVFDLGKFHPAKNLFSEAERIARPKERIVETLTKHFYFDVNVNGVIIKDFIKSYNYLYTIAEILYCASSKMLAPNDQSTYVKEVCIADLEYLSSELTRLYGFDKKYADLLIDRFVFHESNNKNDDIFAQPLIKISKSQVMLCYTIIDQVNIDRAIERQFIRYNINIAAVGHEYEKQFLKALQSGYRNSRVDTVKKKIPNLAVNTNKVEYLAFDGKSIEYDIITTLGDYLILTELKALMTSYDVCDLESRKDNVKKAVQQLNRRAMSVREDWETFKNQVSIEMPDQAYDAEHIILIACTDAYDFTPLQYGKVFVTDDSTYLKYFTSPYVDSLVYDNNVPRIKTLKKLWKDGKPNAHEFVEYLANPTTTHSFSACMKKVENYIPVMDSDDAIIYFEDYQLTEDPVKAEIFGHKENI